MTVVAEFAFVAGVPDVAVSAPPLVFGLDADEFTCKTVFDDPFPGTVVIEVDVDACAESDGTVTVTGVDEGVAEFPDVCTLVSGDGVTGVGV